MRYYVTTVSGFLTAHKGGKVPPGLSAHVIDRAFNCKVVRSFRSEERESRRADGGWGSTIGCNEALRRAREHAVYLNDLDTS